LAALGDVPVWVLGATIRSWRHRAERKVTDLRARSGTDDAGDPGAGFADVQVPTDDWNSSFGCAVKVPARARVVERFDMGSGFVSHGEHRELGGLVARIAGTLAPGDIILLGGERYASFGDVL
jgi:hypothetical protein